MLDNPNATHWSVEHGYQSNINDESELYPKRVFYADFRNSLLIRPGTLLDGSNILCDHKALGFRVALHMPEEIPRTLSDFSNIPLQHDVTLLVKPKVITISDGLRSYAPHTRGCYLKYERQLRFFKMYSQKNCELECLANFTKSECGCVHFAMPSKSTLVIYRFISSVLNDSRKKIDQETVERMFAHL